MAQSQGYAICVWYSVQMEVRRQLARVPSPSPHPIVDSRDGLRSSALAANGYLLTHPAGLQRLLLVCLTLSVEGEIPSQWLITNCRPGLPLLLRALPLASSDFIMRNTGVGREP